MMRFGQCGENVSAPRPQGFPVIIIKVAAKIGMKAAASANNFSNVAEREKPECSPASNGCPRFSRTDEPKGRSKVSVFRSGLIFGQCYRMIRFGSALLNRIAVETFATVQSSLGSGGVVAAPNAAMRQFNSRSI